MFKLFIILSSIILSLCEYKELPKNDYINVVPDTNVYFDISSFDDGESIDFEFEMDLIYGDYTSKTSYTFKIEQVQATSYSDLTSWTGLRQVTIEMYHVILTMFVHLLGQKKSKQEKTIFL